MQCVLFVDDNVLNHWIMTEALTTAGFDVTGACRGADALRFLTNNPGHFDLLLTDIDLPDKMSGLQLAGCWRLLRPGRPTVFASYQMQPLIGRLHDNESFIQKPYQSLDLLEAVRRVLANRHSHHAA